MQAMIVLYIKQSGSPMIQKSTSKGLLKMIIVLISWN